MSQVTFDDLIDLSRIESRYRFRFEPREVLALKTLGDVLETVQRRTNVKCKIASLSALIK